MPATFPPSRTRLSHAEEVELVVAAQERPGPDRDRLVEVYLPLIGSVARVYAGMQCVERRELMQEGVVGLLRALRRYDARLDTPFWAYASWWVRQAMQQLVSEMARPIVLSDRALRQLARVRAAERGLAQQHGRAASQQELAEETGFTIEHIERLMSAARRPRGLEEPIGDDGDDGTVLGERVADPRAEEAYDAVPVRIAVESLPSLLEELDERERGILRERFGLNGEVHTLSELANGLGISAERVRQIEQASLEKCRALTERQHG